MITFINGRIILPDRLLNGFCISVEDDTIKKIFRDTGHYNGTVIDVKGNYISPGFIDIHVHGGGEGDFLDIDIESVRNIISTHTAHGTTGIYPTTLACSDYEVFGAIDTLNKYISSSNHGAEILGVHLEGPYLNMSQRGAQDPKYIKVPMREDYMKLFDYSNLIKRVTFAPEIKNGMDLAKELKSRGIVASIGHSNAEYEDVIRAFNIGVRHVTHIYSGMQGIHRVKGFRKLGIVESAFLIDDMTVEIIADGCHLPFELLKLIYKIKGPRKIALITDAMRAAGRTEGESILGSRKNGQKVILKDGVAFMPDFEAFAGSIATADRLVRNMYKGVGVEIFNAVRMASLTPAEIMGCSCRKGSIQEGKDADILVFDDDIKIKYVMTKGYEYLNYLTD
ncbi:MAG: N-acetylglucosamine-6-phosphate deacetylase [Clostridiales bacterium]|nr:N-acetylglucosamine-6-phosphate deacetylase [Clostridiales bacterium]